MMNEYKELTKALGLDVLHGRFFRNSDTGHIWSGEEYAEMLLATGIEAWNDLSAEEKEDYASMLQFLEGWIVDPAVEEVNEDGSEIEW